MITELVIERTVALSGVGALTVPVTEHVDNTLALDDSPFQITNIDGLGFVKADLASTGRTDTSGEIQTGGSVGKRNIVIDFRLNPNWATQSIADLRRTLYKYFRPTDTVELTFNSDEAPTQVHIFGVVESMEPEMFTQEPSIQVSILCYDPSFKTLTPIVHAGTTETYQALTLENPGTDPTGFEILFEPIASDDVVGTIKLDDPVDSHNPVLWFTGIDTGVDQPVRISTVYGNRFAQIQHADYPLDGTIIGSILPLLAPGSRWPQIPPGSSFLGITTTTVGMVYSLSYYPAYGAL